MKDSMRGQSGRGNNPGSYPGLGSESDLSTLETNTTKDAAALERLGHKQELQRGFSTLSMLGLAFGSVNTWPALAASINLALPSGGTSAVIWGLVAAGLCNLCLAASMAEFLSAYPTAGGQYHWAAIVSWPSASRAVGYVTGWINVAGWVAVSASGSLLATTFIVNLVTLLHPDYGAPPWHQFLIYVALTLLVVGLNVFSTRVLPILFNLSLYLYVGGFVIVAVTVLACASPNYQSGAFVYGNFVNQVGWPDGQAWLLGLLQGAWCLTGFDATAHMIEEIPNPQVYGPRIMVWSVLTGVLTGFLFLSALFFCVKDVERVISAPQGPLLQAFMDATGSVAGSACLVMIPFFGILFTLATLVCASSRMSYAFARDRGMPFSEALARVHPELQVPLNALLWTGGWVVAFGCIYLGSTSTFNAITAASVVSLGITYAIPPAINVLRGRKMLPADRPYKLPEVVGWTVNIVGILWTALTTVLFLFPPRLPVTPSNMNYCIVAFGVILLIALLTWVFGGRKHYTGPTLDVDGLRRGEIGTIEGIAGDESAVATAKR